MKPRHTRRSGFTLVELLAVAGAVSVMGTQLIGAIAEAREAARRTQCKNNLKQLALSLHNYHDVSNTLPPGWVGADSNPKQHNVFGLNGWSWQARILPFLDQGPLYNKIDSTISVTDKQHAALINKSLVYLRCPSDPYSKKQWTMKDAEGTAVAEVATANYAGLFGTGDLSKCEKMKPGEVCEGDGLFFHNSSVRFQNLKDGLSYTLGIGERTIDEKADRMTTWSGVFPKAKSPFARVLGTTEQALDAKEKNVSGFGSSHKGMSHFMHMDGSVRAYLTDTDLKVLQALTTREGGEEVPE